MHVNNELGSSACTSHPNSQTGHFHQRRDFESPFPTVKFHCIHIHCEDLPQLWPHSKHKCVSPPSQYKVAQSMQSSARCDMRKRIRACPLPSFPVISYLRPAYVLNFKAAVHAATWARPTCIHVARLALDQSLSSKLLHAAV